MNTQLDFWLFNKHVNHIKILEIGEDTFRKEIAQKKGYDLYEPNTRHDTVFNWDKITPSYSLSYDYVNIESELSAFLGNTPLVNHQNMLVETAPGRPIIEVKTKYFINYIWDFVRASNGMGAVMATSDYDLVMEFSNDEEYLLFSDFKI
ncbi:hypothetical protein ABWH96_10925 [Marivirga tractuosa]|uniref:hypothetical protein n=1 Tax=Marivirga tractuosa TaxID=1006 RepID=UPI0035D0F97A